MFGGRSSCAAACDDRAAAVYRLNDLAYSNGHLQKPGEFSTSRTRLRSTAQRRVKNAWCASCSEAVPPPNPRRVVGSRRRRPSRAGRSVKVPSREKPTERVTLDAPLLTSRYRRRARQSGTDGLTRFLNVSSRPAAIEIAGSTTSRFDPMEIVGALIRTFAHERLNGRGSTNQQRSCETSPAKMFPA